MPDSADRERRRLLGALLGLPACLQGCADPSQPAGGPAGDTSRPALHTLATAAPDPVDPTDRTDRTDGIGGAAGEDEPDFRHRLYTPTQITRIGDRYFIVDCWHHRIIHSPRLDVPVARWQALDEDIAGPHSIVSDGEVYVTEDTGRHGLKVYRETAPGRFEQVQYLPDIGLRPHRTRYDARQQQFLVVGSGDQSLHAFEVRYGRLVQTRHARVPTLDGEYCRSITLHQGMIHFMTERMIVVHRLEEGRLLHPAKHYPLPERWQSSNDLFFLDDQRALLTSTPGRACLLDDLTQLRSDRVQDLSDAFQGTPYYISQFDGRLWIPEIATPGVAECSAIRSYPTALATNGLGAAHTLIHHARTSQASRERKARLPT